MSSVTIPVMFDDALQWPETQLLKQMLFLRRDFVDTTVFCHAVEEKYNKLLPIFEDLKGKFITFMSNTIMFTDTIPSSLFW